jgi:hypothetical protein
MRVLCGYDMLKSGGINMAKQVEKIQENGDKSSRARLGFSLSSEAQRLLKGLKDRHGITQNALVELAIREKAARDGVE